MRDVTWQNPTAGALDRLANAWRQVLLGIADGLAAAHRYDRLAAMGDAELARLGLTREDVPRFAFFGERQEAGVERGPRSTDGSGGW
jgi:hypothetical protein